VGHSNLAVRDALPGMVRVCCDCRLNTSLGVVAGYGCIFWVARPVATCTQSSMHKCKAHAFFGTVSNNVVRKHQHHELKKAEDKKHHKENREQELNCDLPALHSTMVDCCSWAAHKYQFIIRISAKRC